MAGTDVLTSSPERILTKLDCILGLVAPGVSSAHRPHKLDTDVHLAAKNPMHGSDTSRLLQGVLSTIRGLTHIAAQIQGDYSCVALLM